MFKISKPYTVFESTDPSKYKENDKARKKNHNLSILNYMYTGDQTTMFTCALLDTPAFIVFTDVVTGQNKTRFRIDFNHIRQLSSDKRQAGKSIDKDTMYGPSEIFRAKELDKIKYHRYLFEFMAIMPLSTEAHSYVSQDSAKGHITLSNFNHAVWPWVLKNEQNYNQFCKDLNIEGITYAEWIDHLSDVTHLSLQDRLYWETNTNKYRLK